MVDFHQRILLFPVFSPEFFLCIHNYDLIDRIFLCAEALQKFVKFFSRVICRYDYICFYCIHNSLLSRKDHPHRMVPSAG